MDLEPRVAYRFLQPVLASSEEPSLQGCSREKFQGQSLSGGDAKPGLATKNNNLSKDSVHQCRFAHNLNLGVGLG
jgi:hypothetical protein